MTTVFEILAPTLKHKSLTDGVITKLSTPLCRYTIQEIEFFLRKGTMAIYILDPYNELGTKYFNVLGEPRRIPVYRTKSKVDRASLCIIYPNREKTKYTSEEIAYLDFIFDSYEEAKNNLKTMDSTTSGLESKTLKPSSILSVWQYIDYVTSRLPIIDKPTFTDSQKGLWEFYAPTVLQHKFQKVQTEEAVYARNPALDIQNVPVAIDFGTSSTVVAIRQHGRDELLRIGIQEKDLGKPISAEQFENPTVLEIIHLQELLEAWHSEAYRPLVNWDTVHCSHEAKASLNNNKEADSRVLSSIFHDLKQWALLEGQEAKTEITDQQGKAYTFPALTNFIPTKGQALEINKNYPQLDPLELYAWFLGMNINWRERGIFLDYYMTFPVAYPAEVKEKILAAFRRGLMRSLPEALIYDPSINNFSVSEWVSEPAAFAAAALEKQNIEPTEEGVAYAVFDFGGGTTDFDYGLYRLPNADEEDLYDQVIEHFGASGDRYLGGENLLAHLAYLVFQQNQTACRAQQITFSKPVDAEKFIGYEQLIDDSRIAHNNTQLLTAQLRPLWEQGSLGDEFAGELNLKLLNRQGKVKDCAFQIKQDELLNYLRTRIQTGLKNFFIGLQQAFKQQLPEQVHLFLAGNSSRSTIIKDLLKNLGKAEDTELELHKIFPQQPEWLLHQPLEANITQQDIITAKTGVALGLLRLCPGEGYKVINRSQNSQDNNSPFQFYIGRQRCGKFEVKLKRGDVYNQWHEIGPVSTEGMFILLYTSQAQALSSQGMQRGANGLFEMRLQFSSVTAGHKVFAQAIDAKKIEICTAVSLDEAGGSSCNNLQVVELVE